MRKVLIMTAVLAMAVCTSCMNSDIASSSTGESVVFEWSDTQGNGQGVNASDKLPYQSIEVSSAIDVVMSDTASRIWVSAKEDVQPYIDFTMKNCDDGYQLALAVKWNEYQKQHQNYTGDPVSVVIPAKKVYEIQLTGASSFTYDGSLSLLGGPDGFEADLEGASQLKAPIFGGGDVNLELSGSSSYRGEITAGDVRLELSGASMIESRVGCRVIDVLASGSSMVNLRGKATEEASLDVSGASTVSAMGFKSPNVVGDVTGCSMVEIDCLENIELDISGVSTVTYTGGGSNDCNVDGTSTLIVK